MAKTESVLDIKIQTAEAANSVKDLKSSLKALIDEQAKVGAGSAEFKKLSKAINDTEGKIGDLQDGFSTLRGSGIERTNASLGLLKEGFTNFDAGKIKAGFTGIGAAMKAIPIFLLIEGVRLLIENFEAIFNWLKPVNIELEKLKNLTELQAKHTKTLTSELNREIAILEAQGASHDVILAKKKELMEVQIKEAEANIKLRREKIKDIKANDDVWESIDRVTAAIFRKIGANETADALEKKINLNKALRAKEDFEAIEDSEQKILDLKNSFKIEGIKAEKAEAEGLEKLRKEKEEKNKKADADYLEKYYEKLREKYAFDKQIREDNKREEVNVKAELTELDNSAFLSIMNNRAAEKASHEQSLGEKIKAEEAHRDKLLENINLTEDERIDIIQNSENKIRAEKQKTMDTNLDTTKKGLQAAQAITDLVFAHQLRQAKGNADKEKEIRKKQFNVNKAFGIANAVVDGVGAVQKALNNPYPLNLVLAVISGVLAAANVVKIASTKFDDGGSGGSADTSTASIGSAASAPPPSIANTANTPPSTTQFDDKGKNLSTPVPKVQVVETELTNTQKGVARFENQATF